MTDPPDDPPPLDYAGRTPPPGPLPVAKPAWRPSEENKALAEGCAAMLLLPIAAIVFCILVVIVLAFLLFIFVALHR